MLNVENLIQSGGVLMVAAIVFAESGLLIGFFLPGDTLLFTAGFFASQGILPIQYLIIVTIIAAVVGDNVGYSIGEKLGPKIFNKKDGIIFKQEYIQRAETFYEKHGGKTVTIARFVPIVRTFAPVVAGVGRMPRQKFFAYNIVGAIAWVGGVTMLGYFVGDKVPNIDKYLLPVVFGAVFLTIIPTLFHALKDKRTRSEISLKIKHLVSRK